MSHSSLRAVGVASLLAGLALVACSAEAPVDDATDDSFSNHTVGELVPQNSRYLWIDAPYEDAVRVHDSTEGPYPDADLPDTDPATVWLQTWADRIDGIVRDDSLRRFGQKLVAPKPVIKVVRSSSTFNGWVTTLPTCLGAPFAKKPADAQTNAITFLSQDSASAGAFQCLKPKGWIASEVVSLWNSGKPSCNLSFDGQTFKSGSTCQGGADALGDDTAIAATTPYVRFSTDFLARMRNPNTPVVMLAHELGHFYRSHGTAFFARKYSFWFDRDSRSARRPLPASNAAELEALYRDVLSGAQPIGGLGWSTKVSARVRPFLLEGIAPMLASRGSESFACSAAAKLAQAGLPHFNVGEEALPADKTRYVAYEDALLACADKLKLGTQNAGDQLAAGDVTVAMARTSNAVPKLAANASLGDAIRAIQAAAAKKDASAAKLLGHLRDNRVGVYTTEQEADDIAMELSVRLGFTTDDVLGAWVSFLEGVEGLYLDGGLTRDQLLAQYKATGEVDAATCKSYLDKGFLQPGANGTPTPITISLGSLDDPHHAGCYRLYNLWRESRVHGYKPGPKQTAPSPWETVRARLEEQSKPQL